MEKWFEILRTGKFKDNKGEEHTFAETDLDKIADNYNSGKDQSPIVVGHPKTNSPAYGWIGKLKRAGDKLVALPNQLNKDFVSAVKNGSYKKISVSLLPDLKLRHVGFLGGAAPAVDGLTAVEFNDDEDFIEFAETEAASETFAEETKAEPDDTSVDDLLDKINQLKESINQLKVAAGSKDFSEQLDNLGKQNKELLAKLQAAEFNLFLDKKVEEGKLLPAQKIKALEIMEFASSAESFEFSGSGEKPPVEVIKSFIETLPKQIETSEFSKKLPGSELSEREQALTEIRNSMKKYNN